jgi:tight adherence protein B
MTVALALAAIAAAVAAWLGTPNRIRSRWRRLGGDSTPAPYARRLRVVAPAVLAVGVGVVALPAARPAPHHLLILVTMAGVVWAGVVLAGRGRRSAQLAADRRRVVEMCDAMVSELRAGQPPSRALAWVAGGWPELAATSSLAGMGGDVPAALRTVAAQSGVAPLAQVAAAWDVAHRSGAGLADVLDRLSLTLREDEDVRREITASLGSTRATGRLLAVLPLFGLGLGLAMGADPLAVLLGSTFGAFCLAVGAGLATVGVFWVERIADRAEPC